MRKVIAIVAGLLIVAGTVLVGTGTSKADPTPRHTLKNPLSITGSVVAGVTSVQLDRFLPSISRKEPPVRLCGRGL